MKLRIKTTELTLNLISYLQIIGGVTGLLLICYLLIQTDKVNGPVLLIFLTGLSLFIFSIYCGRVMRFNKNKQYGVIMSLINQIIQLFQWGGLGYAFGYSSGVEFLIGLKTPLSIDFHVGVIVSSFSMTIESNSRFFLDVNLISLFLIIVLIDIYKEIKNKLLIIS